MARICPERLLVAFEPPYLASDAAHHVLSVLAYRAGGGDLGPLRVDFGGGV